MEPKRVIFVSAVSNEFHRAPPEQRHRFESYRDVLKQAFRILAPEYEVIVQEDLIQGFGDLLETLEYEVARSLLRLTTAGISSSSRPSRAVPRSSFFRSSEVLATG
jgi:hypothetical protein